MDAYWKESRFVREVLEGIQAFRRLWETIRAHCGIGGESTEKTPRERLKGC
jgi:hypothetical protein